MSTYTGDIPQSAAAERWNDIFKSQVEKDDPLWQIYLKEAATYDGRMLNDWNSIVDVILVYVALFISVLTAFIGQTSAQLQPDPAAISNDLLNAIYQQLAAIANNTSIPVTDTSSFYVQPKTDHRTAVICNALLYGSLALSIVVSIIALAAKLWLVSYSHRAFSVGSPYDRAMKRQEAYSGLLAWKMGVVINAMPFILLIALIMFGFFVHTSVAALQPRIGYGVGAVLAMGLIALGVGSLGAAFVPACPFRSTFSGVLRLCFEIPEALFKQTLCWMLRLQEEMTPEQTIQQETVQEETIQEKTAQEKTIQKKTIGRRWIRWLWAGTLAFLWISLSALVAYTTLTRSSSWLSLVFAPVTITFAYSMRQRPTHIPQDHRLPRLGGWGCLIIEVIMGVCAYFTGNVPPSYAGFISLYGAALLILAICGWMGTLVAKSMAATREIDAIAWLLKATPSQDPVFFEKAGRLASLDSIGKNYRPRLLKSLMPLLSLLITSHHTDDDSKTQNLLIYVSCLARLSEFVDYEGTWWCLWEDARQHPVLQPDLHDKLVELANLPDHSNLRSAANMVLNFYGQDNQKGNVETTSSVLLWNAVNVMMTSYRRDSDANVEQMDLH